MKKFGTFAGVFVPSYEAIFGAVLFLVLPMLVGEVGWSRMLLIVVLANTATFATAFSIADCTSNLNKVGAGGMYAVSKRSLGKAFGGSIGIQLFIAQAASIGFYAIGFADPLQSIALNFPFFAGLVETYGWSVLVQKQIIATLIALIGFVAGLVGADFVSKIQMIIFVVLSVSVAFILASPFFGITLGGTPLFEPGLNRTGAGLMGLGFWAAFATFFPAVTGIDAGVGMSGNLKDPRRSLAKGTFLAIAVTSVGYILVTWVYARVAPERIFPAGGGAATAVDLFADSALKGLILAGILFATGSSALAYFVTSPRTAQALARDNILPRWLSFLGRDFVKDGQEPRWAVVATLGLVLPVIWAGDVALASLIVGICFLLVYGWVNLAAFFERISGNPSFRPTSRGHWAISLYGFLMCMAVICLFNPLIGGALILSQLSLFLLLRKYKSNNKLEGVWWGLLFTLVGRGFTHMRNIIQGSKNWRPIVGVFCFADRTEQTRETLALAGKIGAYKGYNLINMLKPSRMEVLDAVPPRDAHVISVPGDDYSAAISSLSQGALPGGLAINTVFLPLDNRVNLAGLTEELIALEKNVLLLKEGVVPAESDNRIDVWWKGEENGNLMALLAYIITRRKKQRIRMIRRLFPGEDLEHSRRELEHLLDGARLDGEVVVIPEDERTIHEVIRAASADAGLILIGMPGNRASNLAKMFAIDRVFFSRELSKFKDYPPILFVKASGTVDLLE